MKWSAIDCYEVHNTRREWFDGDGQFHVFVKLMCAYDDRFKLVQDLYTSTLGAEVRFPGRGYSPRAFPHTNSGQAAVNDIDAPLMNTIGVTSASISTMPECFTTDADEQLINSKSTAFVDVQYGKHYDIVETIEYDTDVITQSYRDYLWKHKIMAGGQEVTKDQRLVKELEVPVKTLYSAIITREFVGLAQRDKVNGGMNFLKPHFEKLMECVGFTNPSEYISVPLGKTFKVGTLLMIEPDVTPSIDMQNINPTSGINKFGDSGFSVKAKFLWKKGGKQESGDRIDDVDTHNLFWRPRTDSELGTSFRGGWDRLITKEEAVSNPTGQYTPFPSKTEVSAEWLLPSLTPYPAT